MMAEAYERRIFANMSGQEIVATLATFLAEPPKGDQFAAEIHCSAAVAAAYGQIEDIRERFMILESVPTAEGYRQQSGRYDEGAKAPEAYWHVGADYVDLVYDWLQGTAARTICETYGCYEANFTKVILKASNLVEELVAVATLNADTQLLEKLKDVCLVRDIVVPDSLYLRL
jgi:superfamily II RNA helicase